MSEARYEIIRQLACGGMAEVLLARQNADDGSTRIVVLKRVLAHLSQNDGFLKMFAHEARIASQLRHQNIVQMLEVGEVEGLPVIVMERLEGADLLRLLQQCVTRRQSLGTAVSMAILAGAARGLGYAHRARSSDGRALRLVHRDISPHNVFITRDGGVKLLDFGIAKSAAHVGLTSTGQVKGKISYMSPEQIRSMPIDARSDLWSLGVVLWETLAGEKLFTRDNDAATLHAILHDPIPALNRREAPGLDDLIARVLQRDPAARVGTAEEIAAALEGMLESMRAGPAAKIVAQRVASLVPALSPEFDLARPAAVPSHEVVTLAVGPAGAPSTPKRAPGISPFAAAAPPPPLPASNRYAQGNNPPPARAFDDDVAVDDEPTQMDMPTTSSLPPPDEETTRAVSLPMDEQTVERHSVAPGRVSPPSPPRSSQTPRPPVLPGPARPPINPRSRTSTVMGTGTRPLPSSHDESLGDDPEPLTAQVQRPATIAPPRNATPMMMAPMQGLMGVIPAQMSPSLPPDDLFGAMPGADAASPSLAPPSLTPPFSNALRPGAPSPFSNNPLAGFAARSPDTFVAAEIARPAAPPPPSRAGRWIVATGALMLAVFAGVVVSQRMRAPSAPVAAASAAPASEPMQVVHVPETAASPVVVAAEPPPAAVAAEPPPAAAAEPTAAPTEVAAPAVAAPAVAPTPPPVAVAAPAPVAVPEPAPAPVVAPAPVAVTARAPTPPPVARPRIVPTPAPARVAAAPAPARPVAAPVRVANTPTAARPAPLMDPFETTRAAPARPRAPTPIAAPARVATAPTPVTRAPATPVRRPNDPFDNVYRDPTQRRPVRAPVQAPPSARTGAIATEF